MLQYTQKTYEDNRYLNPAAAQTEGLLDMGFPPLASELVQINSIKKGLANRLMTRCVKAHILFNGLNSNNIVRIAILKANAKIIQGL